MKKALRVVESVLFAAVLLIPAVLPGIALAQSRDDDHSVKQDVKDAGHSTKEAGKVKRGTKKVVSKSATKTAETADKVADKTKP